MRIYFICVFALIWILFLSVGVGPLPALGPLFEVRSGIWQHERVQLESQELPGLREQVIITFDKGGVPHVFAQSPGDLFRAQGFLTASQRLFQLDINTRQTAGKLTELYGSKALYYDQFFTRFGMRSAARAGWEKYAQDPEVKEMVEAYVAGINQWVERMPDLPPEYKVLGARPPVFDPVKIINMGKALTWSLSGRSFDPQLTAYLQKIGAEGVLDLFPEYVPEKYEDFVFPERLGRPHASESPQDFSFVSGLNEIPRFPLPNPGRGSNNWVVGPQKSTTGRSILANDTHLSLTLPNTWYENQLSCPDFNVYGVSLAAIPGVVAGFNKDVAWGPTNGTTDVMDFFEIEFESETSLRYKFNGGWEEASVTREEIPNKRFGSEAVDVIETKLGNVIHREGKLGLAVDWTGYRAGREQYSILKHASHKNAKECLDGFADWQVPIQNFLCADMKDFGFRHAGFIPKRKSGQGRFIMDGRAGAERLVTAVEKVPQSFNPKQGFLESANQKVVPPDYPDYFGWDYEPPFRGMTIRRFLTAKEKLSPEDMMALQMENLDLQAEMILPLLLAHMGDSADPWMARLRSWDFRIRAEQAEAAVYKAWWIAVKEETFGDEFIPGEKPLYPKDARVAWMLERVAKNPADSDAKWFDDVRTIDHKETPDEIVKRAFGKAIERVTKEQGADQSAWNWKNWNLTRFSHAGRLPGFGTPVFPMNGSTETVLGLSSQHGAVYKTVIATGEWPQAWIQVPGGNEGDPFHPDYARYVNDWAQGKMRQVEFYRDADEAVANAARVIYLKPGSAP